VTNGKLGIRTVIETACNYPLRSHPQRASLKWWSELRNLTIEAMMHGMRPLAKNEAECRFGASNV